MTIYILSNDTTECANALDDKSLDSMIKDIAQVLQFTYIYIGSKIEIPNPVAKMQKLGSSLDKWTRREKPDWLSLDNLK